MAAKIKDFELKDLVVEVSKDNNVAKVEVVDGVKVIEKALEEAGVDKNEYEKAYKFDKELTRKLVEFSTNKAEELFKEDGNLESIEFNLPLTTKKLDRLDVMVIKNMEVPAGVGTNEKKEVTRIKVKAKSHRYAIGDVERKRLEEDLRKRILG